MTLEGRRIHITGIVQGVGFRPFVYGLAVRHQLRGWVLNDSSGVRIEVVGLGQTLESFIEALQKEAPPLSVIDAVQVEFLEAPFPHGDNFAIRHSQSHAEAFVPISPDICICDDCLRELFEPDDRRYHYPFINCTNCGPRFTIIQDIPYDRPLTTMAEFPMCSACQEEYNDPLNRRFHAQPNACPQCGPHLSFRGATEKSDQSDIALQMARQSLATGEIVAIKGLGGFHLACDATNESAIKRLRGRKGRVDKPFAIMVRDLAATEQLAELNDAERQQLTSKERPIVLLKKKFPTPLAEGVAPGNQYVGVMLPYTPLHYLFFTAPNPTPFLVMTSGNYSEEPIVKDNEEALERLASLVDAFLLHNRRIHIACDDSVVRIFENRELPIRRSRGYAPFPVKLPFALEPTLAVGGELKNSFCLIKDRFAFMSQHIGDMENLETLQAFEKSVAHFQALFRVEPKIIACDMHPAYLSTRWATKNRATPPIPVQHHHAHIAAVMAEHGLVGDTPVIGFSFDGTGYGPDGAIWGGEVLLADYQNFERVAFLEYIPLLGGDVTIRRPYRMALAHLWAAGVAWDEALPPVAACPTVEKGILKQQLETGFNVVPTSSMGRLFDAVAALTGGHQQISYEAQAAIEFEAIAAEGITESYSWGETAKEIVVSPLIRAVAADVLAQVPAPIISAKFHNAVADLVLQHSLRFRAERDLHQVALSGGVFQNVTLLKQIVSRLRAENFQVLTHRLVPPNDGGLALGQAIIANFIPKTAKE